MDSDPAHTFGTDLYRGTASYYDRFRPPYPAALLADLSRRAGVSGSGRLLDLACGTGQIAIPLSGNFGEVVAVDQEPDSIAFGRSKAEAAEIANIRWTIGPTETVAVDGPFELVTVGTAFHRLDRHRMARRMFGWAQPRCAVALLSADTPNRGDQRWQKEFEAIFEVWMARIGTTDRVPPGWQEAIAAVPHKEILREAGLVYVGKFEFATDQAWTVESLIGFAYSTSILNRLALGEQQAVFEVEMAERLLPLGRDGRFTQAASYAYELALKP